MTAFSRSSTLWRFEPVKCWSRFPYESGGTTRRSKTSPSCETTVAFVFPCALTSETQVSFVKYSVSGGRVGGGGDDVEVLDGLGAPPDRSGLGDLVARRVLAQHLDDRLDGGQRPGEERALLPRLRRLLQRLEDPLLGLGAEPRQRPELLGLRCLAQVLHGRDPEVLPDPAGGLRAQGREPEETRRRRPGPAPCAWSAPRSRRTRRSGRSSTRSSSRFPAGSSPRRRAPARRSGRPTSGSGRPPDGTPAPGTAPLRRARGGRRGGRTARPPARSGAASSPSDDHRDVLVVCLPTYNERENLEAMVSALGESCPPTAEFS